MKEKNIFFHKDFDYFKSEKFSDIGRRNNYIYDNLYIDYKKFCFPDNRYNNLSFQMEGNNNLIYCPITLESKKDEELRNKLDNLLKNFNNRTIPGRATIRRSPIKKFLELKAIE